MAALTALALAALAHVPAHAQSLNGQSVHVTHLYPNTTAVFSNEGTKTVPPTGITFTDGTVSALVNPGQITFTFNASKTFLPVSFNGYQITETGISPVAIAGVTLDPSSNLTGFDASRVTFDATDVFANFQGLAFTPSNNVTIDLSFAPAAVPEPSPALTFAVAALGLGGLALAARRKRADLKASSAL